MICLQRETFFLTSCLLSWTMQPLQKLGLHLKEKNALLIDLKGDP